jgi:acetolactate synthase-1/2/3 large subunit
VLFITGQKPILKSKQGAFQIVDIVKLFHNVTKFCKQARRPPVQARPR